MPTKLLLADDSVTIHKVVGLTFAAEDVLIETVTDGGQALEKVRAVKPDIVLADIFMPVKNGYEVCAAIKSDPDLELIPVVLLVGTFEPFDEDEASRVRCDAYLTKPFDTSELIKIVHHLANQHKEARHSAEPISEDVREAAAVSEAQASGKADGGLVTARTRESFLGAGRILELELPAPGGGKAEEETAKVSETVVPFPEQPVDGPVAPLALDDKLIERIVEKVIRRMSEKAVREIAWEVVPALSETMIRQYLEELKHNRA